VPQKEKRQGKGQEKMSRPKVVEDWSAWHAEWHRQNRERVLAKMAARRVSPIGRYDQHRVHAKRRGITFDLTFDEWWSIWQESGKWEERGRGGYQMCRLGDQGPYAIGNVRIDTQRNNLQERWGHFED
jgi:hypothetical protein